MKVDSHSLSKSTVAALNTPLDTRQRPEIGHLMVERVALLVIARRTILRRFHTRDINPGSIFPTLGDAIELDEAHGCIHNVLSFINAIDHVLDGIRIDGLDESAKLSHHASIFHQMKEFDFDELGLAAAEWRILEIQWLGSLSDIEIVIVLAGRNQGIQQNEGSKCIKGRNEGRR